MKISSKYWKIITFAAAYVFLVYKLSKLDFSQIHFKSLWFLVIPFLLVVVNWSLEAVKWRYILLPVIGKVSFEKALNSVLTGLAAGVLTPNRVGEYFGRTLFSENGRERKRIFVASVYSSFVQVSVTFFAGVISIVFTGFSFDVPWWFIASVTGSLILVTVLFFYFKPEAVSDVVLAVKNQGIKGFLFVFLLSLVRFVIFVLQAYFVAKILGYSGSFYGIFIAMSLMYFVVMFIPSFFWVEIGIRGSVSSFTFPLVGIDAGIGISTVSIVWILNIALPIVYISLKSLWKRFLLKQSITE